MALDFSTCPPAGHQDRVTGYERCEKLFLGRHRELWNLQPGKYQLRRYIVANFAGLISRLCADFLFGEHPDFLAPAGDDDAQEALDNLVARNGLHLMCYESALANSFRGDAVLKVRRGKRTPQSKEPEAIIEEIPASIYFPELDEDNVRHVLRATLAWRKRDPTNPAITYLRLEEHEPGTIRHRLLRYSSGQATEQVPLNTLEAYKDLPEAEETGLEFIPLFHVPNFRYGSRFWGISDYDGLESLFEATNNRLSQVDLVLDKHVAPKIILPPGFLDEDGKVHFEQMETIQIDPGSSPPSYMTWEGQLAAAYQEIDRLLELMFMLSETAPSAFGLDKFGVAESGRALRLRLLRTLAKVNRKRVYYDAGLKAALLTAQLLDVTLGSGKYEAAEPTIQWADGLPEDMVEMVEIESQRLAAGNSSMESSVRRLDGPDAVEAEMGRIAEETGQAVALTGGAGGTRGAAPAGGQE